MKSAKLPKSKLIPVGSMVSANFVVYNGSIGSYRQCSAKIVAVSNDKYGCTYTLRVVDYTGIPGETPGVWAGHKFEADSNEVKSA